MQSISIVRNRGQLTIPDSIRKDEIIIRPHSATIDKNKIWETIRKARMSKGKATKNAAEFLAEDRKSH